MSPEPPNVVPGTSPAARVRARIAAAREDAIGAILAGQSGRAACAAFSDALDDVVRAEVARAAAALPPGLAVVATGGWGRRETCPYSDLDLLFLTADAPDDGTRRVAERVLYPLWDAGLEVGHAVRAVTDAGALAAEDLATATALIDARYLVGDPTVATSLGDLLLAALSRGGDANEFVRRIRDEQRERHRRFGGSVFLLEPNLKQGEGGLRDLAAAAWVARVRWRVRDLGALVAAGQASTRQAVALEVAADFLLRLRAAVHAAAHRRQDQLTFELKEIVAPQLVVGAPLAAADGRPVVAAAVEELMRQYYLAAKTVVREVDRLLLSAIVPPRRAPTIRRLDSSFTLWNHEVSTSDPDVLRTRPAEMVRLFRVALDSGVAVYGHTKERVAELVAGGADLLGDAEAAGHFLSLLTDPRDARSPSLLQEMHDLGLLTALMPELGPVTGRVQHDLYHVFTVDQHQLLSVALMKRLARGELAREAPYATRALALVTRPRALYLATLLHDIGKPLGKDHAAKGARLVRTIARRLRLSDDEVTRAELLVAQHLLMSHLSQRRDLSDVAMIARFARTVGDPGTLAELYLLTYCDTAMTAPGNLTSWKDQLLAELFARTQAFFQRGPDLAGADRSSLVLGRRKRALALVGSGADRWLAGLPDRYFAAVTPSASARHVRLARERGGSGAALAVTAHPKRGLSELSVVAADAPGLLAKIAGVLLANRIDVVGAQIFSRAAAVPDEVAEAIDVFLVRDRAGRVIPASDPRWRRVEADLADVLAGKTAVADLVASRKERHTLPPRITPQVATEVEFDNDVSADFTVIDVYTQDRLGVLYAITRTMTDLALDIALSKVATEAERVADVFYVRDRTSGAKVIAEARLREVRRALEDALCALK